MTDPSLDPRRRRSLLVGCLLGLAAVAVLVVIAVLTGTYVALVGLIAIAGGAFACGLSLRGDLSG